MERTGCAYNELMYLVLAWDASRRVGPGGLRLTWREDTGWSHTLLRTGGEAALPLGPLTALHRVYATPEAVTDVADTLVSRRFRSYDRAWHGEWERAQEVRTAIGVFREPVS
ncbi:hypothetical protein O1Q96_25095 [Streptomyces sp. Qhu-G9]|uniref:hypothetical protein n=1 Tax=Streptomyces sp. Qhu-G9 TaxID=3452799 RepID=UPI0022AC3542|nr:hypothetical protein [Streptomyces aurantiacus]WAU82700.1 hypothetical protein O1Q96_25095 [Streptomyces aurantiacus]